jgi:hypothetical protein
MATDKKAKADKKGKGKGKADKKAKTKGSKKAKAKSGKKAKPKADKAKKPKKKKKAKGRRLSVDAADPELFAPLTDGERADAVRVLTEDLRVAAMAKVGRYRVITVEPQVLKPPSKHANCRLARIVTYDYSAQRTVDAIIDLEEHVVADLTFTKNQPMLSRDEEAIAISLAMADSRIEEALGLGEEPLAAMHYWSNDETELAYSRRSAAVIFGQPGARPSTVAIVDLVDNVVGDVVPAEHW